MDRSSALDLLPEAHAEALRLQDAGLEEVIPQRLGIPAEAVRPLLRLAEHKLAALLQTHADDAPVAGPDDGSIAEP